MAYEIKIQKKGKHTPGEHRKDALEKANKQLDDAKAKIVRTKKELKLRFSK